MLLSSYDRFRRGRGFKLIEEIYLKDYKISILRILKSKIILKKSDISALSMNVWFYWSFRDIIFLIDFRMFYAPNSTFTNQIQKNN